MLQKKEIEHIGSPDIISYKENLRVSFLSSGAYLETKSREEDLNGRTVDELVQSVGPDVVAVYTYTVIETEMIVDGTKVPFASKEPRKVSPVAYIDGTVYERNAIEQKFPKASDLQDKMNGLTIDKVVLTRDGQWHPFREGDYIISSKPPNPNL